MNIEIRQAEPRDAFRIAELHIKFWRAAYKGIIHQTYLDDGMNIGALARRWQKGFEKSKKRTFLAFHGASLVGFVTAGTSRDPRYSNYAELHALYVDPCYFGNGVGKALFRRAFAYVRELGFSKVFVCVLAGNKIGRRFYERMGGTPIANGEEELVIDGLAYIETKYEWKDIGLNKSNAELRD